MNRAFEARLINGPFGDHGLYIDYRWGGRGLLFDLGQNDTFPAADLLRVTHVFVSHCHIDHFIGFDRLLRIFLGQERKLTLYGPPGILECVEGKLRGYTWNLVDGYAFSLEVMEVSPDSIRSAAFRAGTSFKREECVEAPFSGTLLDEPKFRVRATHLNHRIHSMAFAMEEKRRFNIDVPCLERLGVDGGPWLSVLKQALLANESDDFVVTASWKRAGRNHTREFHLGEAKTQFVMETPGVKFAYVVDALYSAENVDRIEGLARGADVFFCESPFLREDEEQATKRYHLTAEQAGLLGRRANVKRLEVFHFSPRYADRREDIYREAEGFFRGQGQEQSANRGTAK